MMRIVILTTVAILIPAPASAGPWDQFDAQNRESAARQHSEDMDRNRQLYGTGYNNSNGRAADAARNQWQYFRYGND